MKDCPVTCLESPGLFCLNNLSSRMQSEDSFSLNSDQYGRGQGSVCRKEISINEVEERKQNIGLDYNSQKNVLIPKSW